MSNFCEDIEWMSDKSPLKILTGDCLLDKTGQKFAVDTLKGKTIGLYVSAHWCPPCKTYTPALAAKYEEIKAKNSDFEIIFISCDSDEKEAAKYYDEMPWTMLAYSERDMQDKITDELEVTGIPSLILLDPKDGSIMMANARNAIMEVPFEKLADYEKEKKDKEAKEKAEFDVMNESLNKLSFLNHDNCVKDKDGNTYSASDFAGKRVGLYFSAHWCPPCRGFTPLLAEKYKEIKAEYPEFEIIFVSSDRSSDDAEQYFSEQPWKMLDFQHRDIKMNLSKAFDVSGIPCLVLLNEKGEVITKEGRRIAMQTPYAEWKKE